MALFLFAMLESIAFSWIMGIEKGWQIINDHADLKIPSFFQYIIKYVTPTMLIIIFVSSLVKPLNGDWSLISWKGWEVDGSSIIGQLMHKGADLSDPNLVYIDATRIYLLCLLLLIWTLIFCTGRIREKKIKEQRMQELQSDSNN